MFYLNNIKYLNLSYNKPPKCICIDPYLYNFNVVVDIDLTYATYAPSLTEYCTLTYP